MAQYNPYGNQYAQYPTTAPFVPVQTSQFGQMGSHVPMQIGTLQSTSSMGLTQQYSTQMQGGKGRGQDSALWMGEIETWMDENFLMSLFIHTGECSHVKIIRDKNTGLPAGYAFIHFNSLHAAQKVLENFQGQPIPGTTKHFRLNWATHTSKAQQQQQQQSFAQQQMRPQITSQASHMTEQQQSQLAQTLSQLTSTQIEELSLFVGDLAPDVNNYFLQSTFQYYYPSCYNARVVVDPQTGQSKGYGFVYFTDETEKNRALTEMQGYYLSYRPIKLNLAVKKAPKQTQQPVERTVAQTKKPTGLSPTDPNNTTVFIGGVDATITQDALYSYFSPFGDIQAVKIPQGRGCAFVEFTTHESAERVLESLKDSCVIGSCHVRLAWGRPAPKPPPLPVVLSSLGVSPPSASQTTTATSTTTTTTTTPPPMITTATAQHAATAVNARLQAESEPKKKEEESKNEGEEQYEPGAEEQYNPEQHETKQVAKEEQTVETSSETKDDAKDSEDGSATTSGESEKKRRPEESPDQDESADQPQKKRKPNAEAEAENEEEQK